MGNDRVGLKEKREGKGGPPYIGGAYLRERVGHHILGERT